MMNTGDNNSDVDKVYALLVSDTAVVLNMVIGGSVEVDVDTDVDDVDVIDVDTDAVDTDVDANAICCDMISVAGCAFLMNSMTSSRSSEE